MKSTAEAETPGVQVLVAPKEAVEDEEHMSALRQAVDAVLGPEVPIVPVDEIPSCGVCGHFDCICEVKKQHDEDCPFRRAMVCAVGIECEHGREVCPICDPCTCGEPDA